MGSLPDRGNNLCPDIQTESVTNTEEKFSLSTSYSCLEYMEFRFMPFIRLRCADVQGSSIPLSLNFLLFCFCNFRAIQLRPLINLFVFVRWGETESTWYVAHCLAYCTSPGSRWNENWQGKPKYWEKTCPSATLSTKNTTWPDLDLNPGRRTASSGSYAGFSP
jgi:hypothetical protein